MKYVSISDFFHNVLVVFISKLFKHVKPKMHKSCYYVRNSFNKKRTSKKYFRFLEIISYLILIPYCESMFKILSSIQYNKWCTALTFEKYNQYLNNSDYMLN